MGLPKSHRLKRRDDFSALYTKGARFKATHLTLRLMRRLHRQGAAGRKMASQNEPLTTRIGISVSLKVDKRAVVRNRIRRQIQAVFRCFLPWLAPGWDLLVVAHPQAVRCDYIQFLQELEQLLVDAEVLHGYPGRCLL